MADQQQPGDESGGGGSGVGKPKPIFSPFPYGSPLQLQQQGAAGGLQTSFTGSPGQRLLLNSFNRSRRSPSNSSLPNGDLNHSRMRGQDLYGGAVMFGGGVNSSFRRSRLMSSSPYTAALRTRQTEKAKSRASMSGPPPSSLPSTASSSPSPSPSSDSMSSTARLILDTLDKMSTPILDAKKIPTPPIVQPRAEKRKLIEEELNCSLKSPQRRRPRLGSFAGPALGGPPLRRNFSPVPTAPLSGALPFTSVSRLSQPPSSSPSPVPVVTEETRPAPAKQSSSFKAKTKVTEVPGRVRGTPDLQALDPPPSPPFTGTSVPQLKVDKMPVFNLPAAGTKSSTAPTLAGTKSSTAPTLAGTKSSTAPTLAGTKSSTAPTSTIISVPSSSPVTLMSVQKPAPESNGVVSSHSEDDSAEEIIDEPNNNKSSKKRSVEDCTAELPNKKTTEVKEKTSANSISDACFSFKPAPPSNCDSVVENNFSKTSEESRLKNTTEVIEQKAALPSFSFSLPQLVPGGEVEVIEASASYSFTSPSTVKTSASAEDSSTTKLVARVTSIPTTNLRRSGISSPKRLLNNLSAMPDVTNNLLKKSPSKDLFKGASSRLPDITASTGFGGFVPAKELKTGSVMDILGKKS